jgi:hypothetical protein
MILGFKFYVMGYIDDLDEMSWVDYFKFLIYMLDFWRSVIVGRLMDQEFRISINRLIDLFELIDCLDFLNLVD